MYGEDIRKPVPLDHIVVIAMRSTDHAQKIRLGNFSLKYQKSFFAV